MHSRSCKNLRSRGLLPLTISVSVWLAISGVSSKAVWRRLCLRPQCISTSGRRPLEQCAQIAALSSRVHNRERATLRPSVLAPQQCRWQSVGRLCLVSDRDRFVQSSVRGNVADRHVDNARLPVSSNASPSKMPHRSGGTLFAPKTHDGIKIPQDM